MAKGKERGEARHKRIQDEQHRPEQNAGYNAAVRGVPAGPNALDKLEDVPPLPAEERRAAEQDDIDEREARGAAADVRRQDRSAE